jgi:hypothetical protein
VSAGVQLRPERRVEVGAPAGARRSLLSSMAFWWAVSLALAAASAAVWPTIPSYDPFSWVVWGREVSDPHISFYVGGGPSWKPLPFFFTTIYGLFGGAAPTLWVITARTGGIAGLIGAWRLAAMLCRRGRLPAWSRWVAGAAAAAGIILTATSSPFAYYFFRGTSEPFLIGVWLWAIERLIARRHWQAYMLVAAEGLMRPEAWPFLLLYGAWLFWKVPSMRAWVLLGWLAQPVGWFVPPWISTGQPLLAATHASDYNGHLGPDRLRAVLSRGAGLQPLPSLVLGIFAALLGCWQARRWPRTPRALLARVAGDRAETGLLVGLGAATVLWWAIVVAMTLDGYPGLERFYLPAAAMTCVLSGYGLVRAAMLVGDGVAWSWRALRGGAGGGAPALAPVRMALALVVIAGILAGSAHFVSARWDYVRAQEPLAATAVRRIDALGRAVSLLGGKRAILPCNASEVTINHSLQTALAWKLGTTLERVQTVLTVPGLAFVGPRDSVDGGPPPIAFKFHAVPLRHVGDWTIYKVYRLGSGSSAPCVGR